MSKTEEEVGSIEEELQLEESWEKIEEGVSIRQKGSKKFVGKGDGSSYRLSGLYCTMEVYVLEGPKEENDTVLMG